MFVLKYIDFCAMFVLVLVEFCAMFVLVGANQRCPDGNSKGLAARTGKLMMAGDAWNKDFIVASNSIKKQAVFTSAKTSPAGGRQRSGRLPEICGRLPEIRGRLPEICGSCRQLAGSCQVG